MDQNNPMQPQGGTQVPPPPGQDVGIRTMQSDNQSLQQGQITPQPQVINPANFPTEANLTPETSNQLESGQVEDLSVAKKSKTWLWLALGVIVLIGLGLLGYFVIYPLLNPPAPIVSPTDEPPAESSLPLPPEEGEAPAPETVVYESAFVVSPNLSITAVLDSVSLQSIRSAYLAQAEQMSNQSLAEVELQDANRYPLAFSALVGALLPDFLDASQVQEWTEDAFTAFIYKDENGIWPGYVARIKADANTETFAQWLDAFEQNDLSGLFVADPGALAEFKNGEVNGISDRYAAGQNGASLGYAIVGQDKLLISTSFEGMKEALRLMGN